MFRIIRFNENVEQDIDDINDILNIARDDLRVKEYHLQYNDGVGVGKKIVIYRFDSERIDSKEIISHNDFIEVVQNIIDRLKSIGYTPVIKQNLLSGDSHRRRWSNDVKEDEMVITMEYRQFKRITTTIGEIQVTDTMEYLISGDVRESVWGKLLMYPTDAEKWALRSFTIEIL